MTAGTSINHIAIIMDGNGRWASQRMMPRSYGHKMGAEAADRVISHCIGLKVPYITLYAMSSENWSRPRHEVEGLMDIIRSYFQDQANRIKEMGARISFIGQRDTLPEDVVDIMRNIERESENGFPHVVFAISYGARDELREAAALMMEAAKSDSISADLGDFLQTAKLGLPDPDLLIRTGGDKRISNFLLWQIAYTEFYFIDKYWPDFTTADFDDAVRWFNSIERRYGK